MATSPLLYQAKCSHNWKTKCLNFLNSKEKLAFSGVDHEKISELLKNREEEQKKLQILHEKITETEKRVTGIDIYHMPPPIHKYDLKLYQIITKVRFDLQCPTNEVHGFVVGKPLCMFNIDTTKYSEQEIVYHMWQLIDPQ